jgi:bifunctional UDP-N-acetylglucosamine pyrophosphorylase/glucosamine-1-phosphate N-acetyltransferase/UDP-N-acetylglucosamine pyrophosphorylase
MGDPIAVVLAAGKGTRMKSDLPKVLCQVHGRPIVEYVLESLRQAGIGHSVVVVGYRADDVKQALAEFDDLSFALQNDQRGTGHAIMMCREQLASTEGPVIVVAGDSPMLQASSIKKLLDEFYATRPACILGTLEHENPTGLGRIVRDGSGKFLGIVEEKDAGDAQKLIKEVNMSTYLFDCQKMLAALDELTDNNRQSEYYLTDLPAILLSKGEDVRALPVLDPVEALSINTVEQLQIVEAEMSRRNHL